MPDLNVHDEQELRASLARWTRKLARERAAVTRRQRLTRLAQRRARQAQAVIERRRKQIQSAAKVTKPARAVQIALKDAQAGVKETGTSNWGGRVTQMLQRFGLGPAPWCGAATGTWYEEAGIHVTPRITYCPYIEEDARAGRNGFARWEPASELSRVPIGSAVLYDWQGDGEADHVGLLVRKNPDGSITVVEGNAQPGSGGDQSNGGGVYVRTRPLNFVRGFAIPKT